MNNKGFTVVELIAAFSITMIISAFLFELLIEVKNIFVETAIKTNIQEKTAIVSKNINNLFKETGNVVSCSSPEACTINGKNITVNRNYSTSVPDKINVNNQEFSMPKDGDEYVKITDIELTPGGQGTEGYLKVKFDITSGNLSKPYKYNVVYYYTK